MWFKTNEFKIKISNRKLSKGLLEDLDIKNQNQQSISLKQSINWIELL